MLTQEFFVIEYLSEGEWVTMHTATRVYFKESMAKKALHLMRRRRGSWMRGMKDEDFRIVTFKRQDTK